MPEQVRHDDQGSRVSDGTVLSFAGVTCERSGRMLFADLSFTLGPGEAALVSGPNGVGKSSLIRIAAGLLRPAAGKVKGDPGRALLTEHASLDDEMPIEAALHFWARLDWNASGPARAVAEALDALSLSDLADIPVRLLSTGQRRRAAIARVVASGAPVWLLDEPANGLDSAALGLLESAIERHRAVGGVALVTSHTPIALPGAQPIALVA